MQEKKPGETHCTLWMFKIELISYFYNTIDKMNNFLITHFFHIYFKGKIGITTDTSYPQAKTDSNDDKIASELALQFYVSVQLLLFILVFFRECFLDSSVYLLLISVWLDYCQVTRFVRTFRSLNYNFATSVSLIIH